MTGNCVDTGVVLPFFYPWIMERKNGLVPYKWTPHNNTHSRPWTYGGDQSDKQQKRPAWESTNAQRMEPVNSWDRTEHSQNNSEGNLKLANGDVSRHRSPDGKRQSSNTYSFDELRDDYDQPKEQFTEDLSKRIRSYDEKYRGVHEYSKSFKDISNRDDVKARAGNPRQRTKARDDPRVNVNNYDQRSNVDSQEHRINAKYRTEPKQYSYDIENRAYDDWLHGGRAIEVSSTQTIN